MPDPMPAAAVPDHQSVAAVGAETDLDTDVDVDLRRLADESRQRAAELKRIAAALPAAQSRRVVLSEMGRDLVGAPDKLVVVRRVVAKLLRSPADLARHLRGR